MSLLEEHKLSCDVLVAGGVGRGTMRVARDPLSGPRNAQRRRVHDLGTARVDALRVTVSATNGLDYTRIREIRVTPPSARS